MPDPERGGDGGWAENGCMGTYVVSGSASGIGAALAQRLSDAGHRVIGVDRAGADVRADLASSDGRAAAVAGVLDKVGGGAIDGLVPCAGIAGLTGVDSEMVVSVNYFGAIALVDGLREAMHEEEPRFVERGLARREEVLHGHLEDVLPLHVDALLALLDHGGLQQRGADEELVADLPQRKRRAVGEIVEKRPEDGLSARLLGDKQLVKTVAWYDNEMSYVSQLVRTVKYFAKLISK